MTSVTVLSDLRHTPLREFRSFVFSQEDHQLRAEP
jgi:hypothetical protein